MVKVRRERVTTHLPRSLVAQMDAYIEEHPWLDRSAVVGEAVALLVASRIVAAGIKVRARPVGPSISEELDIMEQLRCETCKHGRYWCHLHPPTCAAYPTLEIIDIDQNGRHQHRGGASGDRFACSSDSIVLGA